MESKLKTYTFAGGTLAPGFVLTDTEEHGKVLFLGEAGPDSWFVRIPINKNTANQPVLENNIVHDAFLFNVAGGDDRPIFILSRDRSQGGGVLIRFLTLGGDGQGNGDVRRFTGFRSKSLVGGHGRNSGITSTNGIWSDEVWVVYDGELLRVQLAGCDTAYAVRVRNGEPTVEPWVEREPRQEPIAVSELDQELAEMGQSRVAKFNVKYHRQPVVA